MGPPARGARPPGDGECGDSGNDPCDGYASLRNRLLIRLAVETRAPWVARRPPTHLERPWSSARGLPEPRWRAVGERGECEPGVEIIALAKGPNALRRRRVRSRARVAEAAGRTCIRRSAGRGAECEQPRGTEMDVPLRATCRPKGGRTWCQGIGRKKTKGKEIALSAYGCFSTAAASGRFAPIAMSNADRPRLSRRVR